MKRCFKCGELKARSEFYVHRKMADGLLGKCKECHKGDVRANRRGNLERYRAYDKMRFKRDPWRRELAGRWGRDNPDKVAERTAEWSRRNPDKRAAHNTANNAVRGGHLLRKPCNVCGATDNVHAHHEDYSRPLDVVWLCATHHAARHVEIREGT